MPIRVECCPAFDYARAEHTTSIIPDDTIPDIALSPTSPTSPRGGPSGPQTKVLFESKDLSLDLRYIAECVSPEEGAPSGISSKVPIVDLQTLDLSAKGQLGLGACCDLVLEEGQVVTFVLRVPPPPGNGPAKAVKPTRRQADALGVSMQSK